MLRHRKKGLERHFLYLLFEISADIQVFFTSESVVKFDLTLFNIFYISLWNCILKYKIEA